MFFRGLEVLSAAVLLFVPTLLAQGTPESVSNDTPASATILALGAQGDGAIYPSFDVDFWKVTLTGASDIRFWLNPGVGVSMADSDLALIASNGTTELAFNEDADVNNNWLSRIIVGNLPVGDYYLRVRSSASWAPADTGTYTIDVSAAAPGTFTPIVPPVTQVYEAPENNDPRPAFGSGIATASANYTINYGFCSPGGTTGTSATIVGKDYDWYSFVATAVGLHVFTVQAGIQGQLPDPVIHLFDSAFTSLAVYNQPGTQNAFINYTITTPGTYYVCVSSYHGYYGQYGLNIRGALPPSPTGPASVIIRAGGCGGTTLSTRLTNPLSPPIRTELPVLGSTFYLDGAGMQASAPAFRVVGFAPMGAPIDLGAFGGPLGCFVEVDPISAVFILADGNGQDFWPLSTPAIVGLIGLPLQQQLVALHSTLVLVASNRVSSICGITN